MLEKKSLNPHSRSPICSVPHLTNPNSSSNLPRFPQLQRRAATITVIHSSSWVVGASPLLALLLIVSGCHFFSASRQSSHCFLFAPHRVPSSFQTLLLLAVVVSQRSSWSCWRRSLHHRRLRALSLLLFLSELNFLPPSPSLPFLPHCQLNNR
nr:uncharacterized protein LOC112805320 [Arachis hypogaea]